jgi:hypothetical protein
MLECPHGSKDQTKDGPRHPPHLSSSVRRNETSARPSDDDATCGMGYDPASLHALFARALPSPQHRHPAGKDCNPVEMRGGDRSCPPPAGLAPAHSSVHADTTPPCVRPWRRNGRDTVQKEAVRGDKASTLLQRCLVGVDASKQLKRRIQVLGLVARHGGAW